MKKLPLTLVLAACCAALFGQDTIAEKKKQFRLNNVQLQRGGLIGDGYWLDKKEAFFLNGSALYQQYGNRKSLSLLNFVEGNQLTLSATIFVKPFNQSDQYFMHLKARLYASNSQYSDLLYGGTSWLGTGDYTTSSGQELRITEYKNTRVSAKHKFKTIGIGASYLVVFNEQGKISIYTGLGAQLGVLYNFYTSISETKEFYTEIDSDVYRFPTKLSNVENTEFKFETVSHTGAFLMGLRVPIGLEVRLSRCDGFFQHVKVGAEIAYELSQYFGQPQTITLNTGYFGLGVKYEIN